MKNHILLFLSLISIGVWAQPPPPHSSLREDKKEKVEAMRVAFITQKLDLSAVEAQTFWPVYNEFQKKRDLLHSERKDGKYSRKTDIDSLSDSEVEQLVEAEIIRKQKSLDLHKEYHSKFKSVLPIKKVAKLYRAEDQFTHRLLEELSEKRGRGNSHGGKQNGKAPRTDGHPLEKDK